MVQENIKQAWLFQVSQEIITVQLLLALCQCSLRHDKEVTKHLEIDIDMYGQKSLWSKVFNYKSKHFLCIQLYFARSRYMAEITSYTAEVAGSNAILATSS